jgi:aldehyde:ferredoxin oxidoreductase
MAKREGWIGNILAMGPKRAAEAIGGDAPKFAIHMKGAGINLHDWRASWGTLLAQAVGGGSGWSAPSVDAWTPEPDIGYPTYQDPLYPRDKPEAVKQTGIKKYWEDCIGVCWFATRGVPNALTFTAEALSAATGWTFSPEEALKVGERMITFERVFNIKHGLSPADDLNISPRFLESPPSGRAKGKSIKPYLEWMVMEYYRLMGWDEKTGKPWRSTLQRLSLEDFAEDIYR